MAQSRGKQNPAASSEWVFVFDISSPKPVQKQAIAVPNTYSGIAFSPDGTEFYVAGGDDDNVHIFSRGDGGWSEKGLPVALGHLAKIDKENGNFGGIGIETEPEAAGLAVSSDGKNIVVANFENDSISVLTKGESGWAKSGELDLTAGGDRSEESYRSSGRRVSLLGADQGQRDCLCFEHSRSGDRCCLAQRANRL